MIAAYLTGVHGMSHVELRFSNGESFSIYQNETVFLKKRGYSNTRYEIMPLTKIDANQEALMYSFAQKQVGKPFNSSGLRRAWLPSLLRRATDGSEANGCWFCSELITSTLQRAGLVAGLQANGSSPNALYVLARRSAANLGGVVGVNTLAMQQRQKNISFATLMRPLQQSNGSAVK